MKLRLSLRYAPVLLMLVGPLQAAEPLTLRKAVQLTIDNYPAVRISKLQLDKAGQDVVRADSQLGWQLNAEVGYAHDTGQSIFPSDTLTAGGGIQRQLESGGTLGFQGGYRLLDNTADPSVAAVIPLTTTQADIIYRRPLGQGAGNPLYAQSAIGAQAGLKIARAGHRRLLNSIVQQTIDLYYGMAVTQARKQTATNSVARAERLLAYVKRNTGLGLTEKKDVLQAEAQLQAQKADLETLKTAWEQQRTALNRLVGKPWDTEHDLVSVNSEGLPGNNVDELIAQVLAANPDIAHLEAQMKISEATLNVARDRHKSRLDLVMSAGARTGSGTTVDEQDYAASVKLEYQRPLSRQGLKAEVFQAQISNDIARREMEKADQDLRYQVRSLVAEITTGESALAVSRQRLSTERDKLADTRRRYRTGRADTSQLIQFENELSFAEFAVAQQTIELARKQHALKLLRGVLWDEFQLENTGLEANQ